MYKLDSACALFILLMPIAASADEFGFACGNKTMETSNLVENAAEGATTAFTNTHAMLCLDELNCIVFQYALTEDTGNWLYIAESGKSIRANPLSLILNGSYLMTMANGIEVRVSGECTEVTKPAVQQFIDMAIKENSLQ